jgi:hypothetical protein
MREFSITNDHLKTVIPAKAGTQVCLSDEMGLSATNLAGGGFRKHAAATHFLCSAKESKQRKAPRGSSPFGFPALLAAAGHSQNSGWYVVPRKRFWFGSPSKIARGKPLRLLRCSATCTGMLTR